MREHRAGLEKGNAKADSAEIGGRLPGHTEQARVREQEDVKSDDCGVLVRRGSGDGMGAEESRRNTGSPASRALRLKQESREGQAWVVGVAERPVGVKTRVTSAEQRSLSSKATQQVGQERRLAKTYDLLRSSGNYKKRCMPTKA